LLPSRTDPPRMNQSCSKPTRGAHVGVPLPGVNGSAVPTLREITDLAKNDASHIVFQYY